MNGFYRITVCSLPDYENLVAEVYIHDKFIGLISQEKAEGQFLLELGQTEGAINLTVFENAVAEAKEKLGSLRRPTSA